MGSPTNLEYCMLERVAELERRNDELDSRCLKLKMLLDCSFESIIKLIGHKAEDQALFAQLKETM